MKKKQKQKNKWKKRERERGLLHNISENTTKKDWKPQLPVPHACTQWNPLRGHVTDVTIGEKARPGRILWNLRLRIRTPKGTPSGSRDHGTCTTFFKKSAGTIRACAEHTCVTSFSVAPNVALSVPIYCFYLYLLNLFLIVLLCVDSSLNCKMNKKLRVLSSSVVFSRLEFWKIIAQYKLDNMSSAFWHLDMISYCRYVNVTGIFFCRRIILKYLIVNVKDTYIQIKVVFIV
jgi:hypothetical protein